MFMLFIIVVQSITTRTERFDYNCAKLNIKICYVNLVACKYLFSVNNYLKCSYEYKSNIPDPAKLIFDDKFSLLVQELLKLRSC
jgi:hypothetical protein